MMDLNVAVRHSLSCPKLVSESARSTLTPDIAFFAWAMAWEGEGRVEGNTKELWIIDLWNLDASEVDRRKAAELLIPGSE